MNKKSLLPFTLLLLALTLFLPGCGAGSQPKGRRPSADWSRGLPVGSNLRGAVTISVEPDGEPDVAYYCAEEDLEWVALDGSPA